MGDLIDKKRIADGLKCSFAGSNYRFEKIKSCIKSNDCPDW